MLLKLGTTLSSREAIAIVLADGEDAVSFASADNDLFDRLLDASPRLTLRILEFVDSKLILDAERHDRLARSDLLGGLETLRLSAEWSEGAPTPFDAPRLKRLSLPSLRSAAVLRAFSRSLRLTSLDLSFGGKCGPALAAMLSDAQFLPALTELSLTACDLTDDDALRIAESGRSLKSLDLSKNLIGANGAIALAKNDAFIEDAIDLRANRIPKKAAVLLASRFGNRVLL